MICGYHPSPCRSRLNFYDEFAPYTHLIFQDWDRGVRWQGEAIDGLLGGPRRVLDCSCGIGTQAIGLALRGYDVLGTDVSVASIVRARREAERLGASVQFRIADMRTLDGVPEGFDAAISFDNALPHLLSRDDLLQAARAIHSRLRPGGVFAASIRDYDQVLRDHPTTDMPRVHPDRITFQTWHWRDDRIYDFRQFLLLDRGGQWETKCFGGTYRALPRDELTAILREAGFLSIEWKTAEQAGYFQPVVVAMRD